MESAFAVRRTSLTTDNPTVYNPGALSGVGPEKTLAGLNPQL